MSPQLEQNTPIYEQLTQAPLLVSKTPFGVKNLKYKIVILIIFLVFVAGIKYKFLIEQNIESQINSQIASQTDLTQDWKTYRNDEYGFEFKYPNIYESSKAQELIKFNG